MYEKKTENTNNLYKKCRRYRNKFNEIRTETNVKIELAYLEYIKKYCKKYS